ncbi:MAG: PLP-dependent aminotransferase family protein [Clostridia bacterium]|nr:PLP-dependent aminotransferase family protein [Clostridia bacterium]
MEYRISNKLANLAPSAIREIFKSLTDPEIIAFAAGNPAAESFPVDFIRSAAADVLNDMPITALQYGITEGQPGLRAATRQRLASVFGIGREFDDTVIVTGGQQGIELACKTMCNEGDVVISENPSFIGALNAFRSNGARIVGVDVDDDGMNVEKLEAALKANPEAKLIYIIPTFQNPMGITTPLEKRKAIYALAKQYNVMILEDNPYGELRFSGKDVPTFKSMDEDGIVIYCGSYSKVLSSGLRLGFVCAPKTVLSKMIVAKQVEDVHTNVLSQLICEKFVTSDKFEPHLDSVRALYRRKCGLMLDEMDKCFPKEVKYTRPEGGLFLWCTLPEGIELGDFVQSALARKVAVVPGVAFNCDPAAPSDSFRMNYSTPSDEQIVRGVRILGEILNEKLGK